MKNLAKLEISKKEEEKLQKDLKDILKYIDVLNEVDISDIEPISNDVFNVLREDRVEEFKDFKIEIIKVKSVFND